MESINIHEAKTHLSRLIAKVSQGEGFIIAKAGKPVAKITAIDAPDSKETKRLGFLAGEFKIPDDFDRMGEEEIADMFGASNR